MLLKNGLSFIDQDDNTIIIVSLPGGLVEYLTDDVRRGVFLKRTTTKENFLINCNRGTIQPLFRTREENPIFTTYAPKTIIINL